MGTNKKPKYMVNGRIFSTREEANAYSCGFAEGKTTREPTWKQVTLKEALLFSIGRTVVKEYVDTTKFLEEGIVGSGTGVTFNDGSMLYSHSDWTGPYSEVTPDIDANPPRIWLFVKELNNES